MSYFTYITYVAYGDMQAIIRAGQYHGILAILQYLNEIISVAMYVPSRFQGSDNIIDITMVACLAF